MCCARTKSPWCLTTPLVADGPLNDHLNRHGDGVKAVALWVDGRRQEAGRKPPPAAPSAFSAPETREDSHGKVVLSGIETYGDTIHVFVERKDYSGVFLPGYQPWAPKGHVQSPLASSTSTTWWATWAGVR